jgi:hypothetical protein
MTDDFITPKQRLGIKCKLMLLVQVGLMVAAFLFFFLLFCIAEVGNYVNS